MLWAQIRQAAIVAGIAGFVMLLNLGGSRLWDRDEPRNAGAAREMLARHDWVVPWFNGELRTHKPVLLYWCIMASYSGLGVNEFAARLPSALCAIGSVLCVYRIGRRLFGPRAGLWAGISLSTSLMFVVAGRAATPDSLLVFCSTLALTIYVCGTFRPRFETTPLDTPPQLIAQGQYFPQHWPTVLALYGAMGLGVLAKGPVGLVLPTAVIGMFLLIMRLPGRPESSLPWSAGRVLMLLSAPFEPLHFVKTCWLMRPLTAIFAAAAVALPWYWAVGLATNGEFLRGFFLEHNLGRATAALEHHGGTVFYYPLAILVGFFPWSVFAVPLAIDSALQLKRRDQLHAGYLLAACWICVYVALFSVARTKLPSYVTPCYPALALLVGNYVDRWSRQSAAVAGRWLLAAFGCLSAVGAGIAIVVPIVAKDVLPGEEWLGLLGLVPLAGGVACLGLAAVHSYRAAAASFAIAAVTFASLLFSVAAHRIDQHQAYDHLWQAIHARSAEPIIASYKALEPSWVFYSGQTIHELSGPRGEAAIRHLAANRNAFLITTDQKLRDFSSVMPPDVAVVATAPYFLRGNQRLVVLGRNGPAAANSALASPRPTIYHDLR